MSELAITVSFKGKMEDAVVKVTEAIKPAGFGVLTRIDFDKKIKEKTGEVIAPVVILGACNPALALRAYRAMTETALLIPCNVALTQVSENEIRVEAIRPSKMLEMLPGLAIDKEVQVAETQLEKGLSSLTCRPEV